jgi:hypothetical protein
LPFSVNFYRHIEILSFGRDAWSLGAIDPTSGTATLLEITRALGEMYKNGTSSCFHFNATKIIFFHI